MIAIRFARPALLALTAALLAATGTATLAQTPGSAPVSAPMPAPNVGPNTGPIAVPTMGPDMARVLSSIPIVQQVTTGQTVCSSQQMVTPGSNSGAGAVMGAIAGGAMGNAIGNGGGRAAATMLGLVGGALIGNQIEGSGQPQVQTVQNCAQQPVFESRTVGYSVTYEYAGHQYTVQMAHDPGPYLPVQVVPAGSASPYTPPNVTTPAVTPAPVMYSPSSYYVPPAFYPPVSLQFGYVRPYYSRHHGWR